MHAPDLSFLSPFQAFAKAYAHALTKAEDAHTIAELRSVAHVFERGVNVLRECCRLGELMYDP